MFIRWNHSCVRLTGRWSRNTEEGHDHSLFIQSTAAYTTTTAPGSYFEMAFEGDMALLKFDMGYLGQPFPHIWIQLDGGASIESPVDRCLRVCAPNYGRHVMKVTYKGGMEMLPRWYLPLAGAVSFIGAEVDAPAELEPDNRRIIEFIGDSITEGVLVDADFGMAADDPAHMLDQWNRPFEDDNLATYGALTAKALNLRPIFQAYGATGMTRSGCASVPRAGLIYPYVYDGVPYTGEKPDIVVINHGANDRGATKEEYLMRYAEFIDIVRKNTPDAIIVCLSAFVGAFDAELGAFVTEYNRTHEKPVHFISSKGWVPAEPLHPLRDGHRSIANHLVPLLKEIIG